MTSCRKRDALHQAIAHALAGDWQAAHRLVQLHEDDPTACWIHAILHRIEGDDGNADYCYRRAGRTRPDLDPHDELRRIDPGRC